MRYTTEELKEMNKEMIRAELGNRVYAAAQFMEQLKHADRIFGSGHRQAQDIADFAQNQLDIVWKK